MYLNFCVQFWQTTLTHSRKTFPLQKIWGEKNRVLKFSCFLLSAVKFALWHKLERRHDGVPPKTTELQYKMGGAYVVFDGALHDSWTARDLTCITT